MLVECLAWRKGFGVDGILKEEFAEEIDSLGYIHKHDKQGNSLSSYPVVHCLHFTKDVL